MTTIHDINDLVRVLQERPDWLTVVRNLVIGEELLNLPRQFTQFVNSTEENFRKVDERFRQVDERFEQVDERFEQIDERFRQIDERFEQVDRRLNRLEGRVGNLEGHNYERRVRTRLLLRMARNFGMDSPFIALHQEGQISPELNRMYAQAIRSDAVTPDELDDLQEADIIISDADHRHAVVEVSITTDSNDIERAARRANVLSTLSNSSVVAAVATANLPEPQRSLADGRDVTVFIIPDR